MRRALVGGVLLLAASCGNPAGIVDGRLNGTWVAPDASLQGKPHVMMVWDSAFSGRSDAGVVVREGVRFEEPGTWTPRTAFTPVRVRFVGRLDLRYNRLLLSVIDSASGERLFSRWFRHVPIDPNAPPPSAPPVAP